MALSRPLFWVRRSIRCQPVTASPPVAPGCAVLGIVSPRNWTLKKQNADLFLAIAPWKSGGLRSRRISGGNVHFVPPLHFSKAGGRVEEGEGGGEVVTSDGGASRKSPRRRRRYRKKAGQEIAADSPNTRPGGDDETSAIELLGSGSLGTGINSQSAGAGVGVGHTPSPKSGPVVRDDGGATISGSTSAAAPVVRASSELENARGTGVEEGFGKEASTSSSPPVIEEQGPKESQRKKRRSRRGKARTSNVDKNPATVDASLTPDRSHSSASNSSSHEINNSVSIASSNTLEGAGRSNVEGEVRDALETSETANIAVLQEDGGQVDRKKMSRKKSVGDHEGRRRASESRTRSSGFDEAVAGSESVVVNGGAGSSSSYDGDGDGAGEGGSQDGKKLSVLQSSNGQATPKLKKKRGRRKKAVGKAADTSNERDSDAASGNEAGGGSLKPALESGQSGQSISRAAGSGQGDGEHLVEDRQESLSDRSDQQILVAAPVTIPDDIVSGKPKDTQRRDKAQVAFQDNRYEGGHYLQQPRSNEQASKLKKGQPKGSGIKGAVPFSSGETIKTSSVPFVSEGEESHRDDSDSPKAPRRRRRRTRRRRASESLQTDPQAEQNFNDLLDTITWCTVHLKVRAELEDDQHLYVVGANPELGGWDLSLALALPESEEEGDEGKYANTLKIPRGTMLEYKYFIESRHEDSGVIERSFGPEVQYFLPWKEGKGSDVEIIRDTWIPDMPKNLPLLSWGDRWWEEIDSLDAQEVDVRQGESVEEFDQEGQLSAISPENAEPSDAFETEGVKTAGTEDLDEWQKRKIRRKVFPREEPWLLESMIMEQRTKSSLRKGVESTAAASGAATDGPEAEHVDPGVEVEILINSPQCTMQRMAILEDGKLVELLIEPVNTRVQVGNIYLGVVRQLLPGMTGVFVDIGGFQLALLDITRNQYPYTFPSISQSTGVSVDGQAWSLFDDDEEDSDWEGAEAEGEEEEDEGEHEDEDDADDDIIDDDEEGAHEEIGEDGEVEGLRSENQEGHNLNSSSKVAHRVYDVARPESFSTQGPITVNFGRKLKKWSRLREGMQIIVQVKKEALGKKGPRLTAFPSLAGRFWVLIPGGKAVGVSRRITGPERKRLRELAQDLQPMNFALTVRTEALGRDREDLEKDLTRLIETWKDVLERASAAAVVTEHGVDGGVPVLLHRAMGQTLTLVRDFFTDKVRRMVIDSPQCYQEVTSYLQEVAPQLSDRVELYTDTTPIFDTFNVESEFDKFFSKRVSLPNGGYLVMEETEALVSIDVNGGTGVLSHDLSQREAILAVNLAAARQIATELRLRDIGGIIVVDFIDMDDDKSEKLVLDEMRKATARDRSSLSFSEISELGLMEMTRKRVRPSVTLTISDPCSHCGGLGRVEAHESTLSKIEREVRRLLALRPGQTSSLDSSKWPQFILRVDSVMGEYLKGRKRKRLTQLSTALKVWLTLKVIMDLSTGQFQVLEQHRTGSEKRSNGSGQTKANQQNVSTPGLLGKKGVWPSKRRRNFANQMSIKAS